MIKVAQIGKSTSECLICILYFIEIKEIKNIYARADFSGSFMMWGELYLEYIIQTRDRWPSVPSCLRILPKITEVLCKIC